jgi:RNA polymerase sigma-70 factor (family 1)
MKKTKHYFIVMQFRKGELKAFREIYDLYHAQVRYFIVRLIKNEPQAEEITSDTFAKLWKLRGNFNNLINIRSFLFVTARNASIDYLRWNQSNKQQHYEYEYLSNQDTEKTICEEIEDLLVEHLFQKIQTLPPQTSRVMKLAYIDGLKNTEIALQLEISVRTVKNIKNYALKILRNDMYCQNLRLLMLKHSCRCGA